MGSGAGKNNRIIKKQLGLCLTCDSPSVDGGVHCNKCMISEPIRIAKIHRKHKSFNGVCEKCGDVSYLKVCGNCKTSKQKYQEQRRERLKNEGRCVRCSTYENMIDTRCRKCLLKGVSLSNTGTKKNWKFFDELLDKQNSECFYTGKKLILGENASIDHLMPVSKFPNLRTHSKNLVWADKFVNVAKSSLTYAEFISLCKTIIKNSHEHHGNIETYILGSEILEGIIKNKN